MIIIPFKSKNPEKSYKHYSYAEYYSVSIKSETDVFSKDFTYDFIREYDTFYDSQFNKETVQQYFAGDPDTDKVQLVSDNGYTYTIDLKNDVCINKGNALYFIPKGKMFKKFYSINQIRNFVDIIVKIKDYDLLKKYSKLIDEDFSSLDAEDVYNLVNIEKEINKTKEEYNKYDYLLFRNYFEGENLLDTYLMTEIKRDICDMYKIDQNSNIYYSSTLKPAYCKISQIYENRYEYLNESTLEILPYIRSNMISLGFMKKEEQLDEVIIKLKENKSDEFNDIMDMVYLKANHDMNNSYQGGF